MKAQGALEYLIIIAAVLAISAIVVLFVTGAFSGASGGADLSKCRVAASNCNRDITLHAGTTCSSCETACLDSKGKDIVSGELGCGIACMSCKSGILPTAGTNQRVLLSAAFNEGSGSTTADSSPNALVGTLTNAQWDPAGKSGSAIRILPGTSSNVLFSSSILNSLNYTVMAWIKITSINVGQAYAIVNGVPGTGQSGFALYFSTTAPLYLYYKQNLTMLGYWSTGGQTLFPMDWSWHHVAATCSYNGADTVLNLYVNGVSSMPTRTHAGERPTFATGTLRAGNTYSTFAGSIDNLRFYNYAMSAQEVAARYNSEK